MAKIKCPRWRCKSIECTPLAQTKSFSIAKGALGGGIGFILAGPFGLVGAGAGFNGKKKVKMMCNKCGKVFTIKV